MKLGLSTRSLAVLCCSLFLSASLNPQPLASDPAVARLEKALPDFMRQADVPGLAIAVIRHGKPYWQHNFGVKNAKTNEPATDETIFEAASLSKPVFAYAVLKLVDQGKLALDAPLSTYLTKPYIEENDSRLTKITARFVLSHRTGFRNWRNDEPLKIYFTPGERFSYSGEGYIYLQTVVEQITGKPLNDVMNELVFTPFGMTSSSYVWRPAFDALTATGHDPDAHPTDLWKPDHLRNSSWHRPHARHSSRNGNSPNRRRPRMHQLHRSNSENTLQKYFLGTGLGHRAERQIENTLALGRQRRVQVFCRRRSFSQIRRRHVHQ